MLKPGGVLDLDRAPPQGPPPGLPGILMFDEVELRGLLLDGLEWELLEPFDARLTAATLAGATTPAQVERRVSSAGDWLRVPHLVLRHEDWLWTSCHLALVKPG